MKKLFRLIPSLHNNIWGGYKLKDYGKDNNGEKMAESWELSFVPGNEAKIDTGMPLSEVFSKSDWGEAWQDFEFFPVLTKFIDAKDKLSVQVHPSDEYALKHEGQYGKSEMWYVVDAEEGAGLYMGLERSCTEEEFSRAVNDGSVEKLLSFKKVSKGDVFFIPAGTIHAIGSGVLIFEIQQNSTLTYRLYDYMRRDKDGNLRPLHVEKAMKVSSLTPYKEVRFEADPAVIGSCDYFTTRKYCLKNDTLPIQTSKNSFICFTCTDGEGAIRYKSDNDEYCETVKRGDSFFAPACDCIFNLEGSMTIITVSR